MASFNKVMLMGNLTRDPQVKHLPSSMVVAEFGLAVSRRFKTANGEDREEVAFVDCTAFGKQAEVIGQYCVKGKPIFVEGRLKFDTWEDKMGHGKRSKLTVVVENFQFLPSPRDGANNDSPFPGTQSAANGDPDSSPSASSSSGTRGRGESAGKGGSAGDGQQAEMFAGKERKQWRGRGERPARATAGAAAAEKPYGEEKHFEEQDIPF